MPKSKSDPVVDELQKSYDLVAGDYAENFRDELAHKPFDRKMIDWLIEKVGDAGTICDLGCGPGQIARFISDRGGNVCGIDISQGMVEHAATLNPGIEFSQGNMLDLADVADGSFAGIAAFYSIIHVPREMLGQALSEMHRVLKTGGVALVTFHIGSETVHMDEWFEKKVYLDFNFLETGEIKTKLTEASFALQEVIERDPYPEIEYQSRRAYIFAQKA